MNWSECESRFVRIVSIDSNKIKSILKTATKRELWIKEMEVTEDNVSFIIENYYEIIKELLVALLLSKGLKSQNHQCLITYFHKNYPGQESMAHLIKELNYVRNRLNYYGELINFSVYDKNRDKIIKTIDLLRGLIKK